MNEKSNGNEDDFGFYVFTVVLICGSCIGSYSIYHTLEVALKWLGILALSLLIGLGAVYLFVIPYCTLARFLSKRQTSREEWYESVDASIKQSAKYIDRFQGRYSTFEDDLKQIREALQLINQKMAALKAYEEGTQMLEVKKAAEKIVQTL